MQIVLRMIINRQQGNIPKRVAKDDLHEVVESQNTDGTLSSSAKNANILRMTTNRQQAKITQRISKIVKNQQLMRHFMDNGSATCMRKNAPVFYSSHIKNKCFF